MVGKTKAPTAAERRRMDALSRLPCACCVMLGLKQPNQTEVHHIVEGMRRLGHAFTLPLCGFHHRGSLPTYWNYAGAEARYGPSLAKNKRAFVAMFGTERELLLRTNARLVDEAG